MQIRSWTCFRVRRLWRWAAGVAGLSIGAHTYLRREHRGVANSAYYPGNIVKTARSLSRSLASYDFLISHQLRYLQLVTNWALGVRMEHEGDTFARTRQHEIHLGLRSWQWRTKCGMHLSFGRRGKNY
jgi:hypothetical protein